MNEAGSWTGAFWPLATFADVSVRFVLEPSTQYVYVAASASLSPSVTVEVRTGGVVAIVFPITGYGGMTSHPYEAELTTAVSPFGWSGTWLYVIVSDGSVWNLLNKL